jgi:hypothetical protein
MRTHQTLEMRASVHARQFHMLGYLVPKLQPLQLNAHLS